MKFFAVVLLLCLFSCALGDVLTEEQKAKLRQYKEECTQETGVEASAIEEAKKGNIDQNNEKLACFAACLLKKIGIMTPEGTINEDVARAKIPASIPREKAEEVINKCKSLTGANMCETAAKVFTCYMKEKTFSILE